MGLSRRGVLLLGLVVEVGLEAFELAPLQLGDADAAPRVGGADRGGVEYLAYRSFVADGGRSPDSKV
jgi:hypothetical protein